MMKKCRVQITFLGWIAVRVIERKKEGERPRERRTTYSTESERWTTVVAPSEINPAPFRPERRRSTSLEPELHSAFDLHGEIILTFRRSKQMLEKTTDRSGSPPNLSAGTDICGGPPSCAESIFTGLLRPPPFIIPHLSCWSSKGNFFILS